MSDLKFNNAKKDLISFLENQFNGRIFFSVVYGSYAYGTQKETSDLDIIVAVDRILEDDISKCVSFVTDLHKKHRMNLDFEIRHENKLVIDYRFLDRTVSGDGFLAKDGQFYIPKIIKTAEHLNSKKLLLRFFLDSMVHKHKFLTGNVGCYTQYRKFAVESLVRIILNCKNIKEISAKDLVKEFIYNNKITGDYYLGFEDKPYYHDYLELLFIYLFQQLAVEKKAVAEKDNTGIFTFDKKWLSEKPNFKLKNDY